jgi:hypothetical protein
MNPKPSPVSQPFATLEVTDMNAPAPRAIEQAAARSADVYVEDVEFNAIHAEADVPLQEFMDLAYLVGQRPGDLRRLENVAARGDALRVQQSKTGTKLRVAIEGRLAKLLAKMDRRKETIRVGGKVVSASLLVDEDEPANGQGQNALSLRQGPRCGED